MPHRARVALDQGSFAAAMKAYRKAMLTPDHKSNGTPFDAIDLVIDGVAVQGVIELVSLNASAEVTHVLVHIIEEAEGAPNKYVIVNPTSGGEWTAEPAYHVAPGIDTSAVCVHYLAYSPTDDNL